MKRDKFYRRLFEIIPGALTWGTILGLFTFAFIKPVWVAIFVIVFDLFWMIRMMYLTTLLVFAYRRLAREKGINWIKRCGELLPAGGLEYSHIYQAVLFPVYKEDMDVLTASIDALIHSNYPKDKIIVVLSVEE
ncbi:MAG: hypothetical protein WCK38_04385, partial [Candidatus Omnitrophota bacterium]